MRTRGHHCRDVNKTEFGDRLIYYTKSSWWISFHITRILHTYTKTILGLYIYLKKLNFNHNILKQNNIKVLLSLLYSDATFAKFSKLDPYLYPT